MAPIRSKLELERSFQSLKNVIINFVYLQRWVDVWLVDCAYLPTSTSIDLIVPDTFTYSMIVYNNTWLCIRNKLLPTHHIPTAFIIIFKLFLVFWSLNVDRSLYEGCKNCK